MSKLDKLGSSPISYGKMVFMDKAKEEEWDSMDPKLKGWVISHLKETCDKLENKQAIDLLCLVIIDLQGRIEKLESAKS